MKRGVKSRNKTYWVIVSFFTINLLTILFIGVNSIVQAKRELNRQHYNHEILSHQIADVQARVESKEEYLQKLLHDPDFLQRVSRQRLGYSRPDEMIFRFESEENTKKP